MDYKDYYATLGVERTASQDDIKRAYRKLTRKYHPDVSQEPGAEEKFKEVSEAYKALGDPQRRAAYDDVGRRYAQGQTFDPPPGWDSGFEFSGGADDVRDFAGSDFFEALFGRAARGAGGRRATGGAGAGAAGVSFPGEDHHARIRIDLRDAYHGARRTVTMRAPQLQPDGRVVLVAREIDLDVPRGVRAGQHLRLAGQGGPGHGGGPAGDLYLEIEFVPDPVFRVDGRDVQVDLPVAPWEAALGARVELPTPDGTLEVGVPAGSASGRRLRLKGRGVPGDPPGDLYAVLAIVNPPSDSAAAQQAWRALAGAFPGFDPRRGQHGA